MPSERSAPNFRVKLYQLKSDSNWEDKGTGHCVYEMGVEGEPDMLVVQSEENGKTLLYSGVRSGRFFQKQQDTLIVWTEDTGKDLALSFQDSLGCDKIWQYIGEARADMREDEHEPAAATEQDSTESTSLPDLQLSTIKDLTEIILRTVPEEREEIVSFILSNNCVEKLVNMFQSIDMESPSFKIDTQNMFNFIFALLSLQDRRVIDTITQKQYIFTIVHILEFDPAVPQPKANYRRQLKKAENAKQLVHVRDEAMEQTMKQAIRLSFLESIVRQLNCWGPTPYELEGIMGILNNMYLQNCSEILKYIHQSDYFLPSLFELAKEQPESRKDVMGFVNELYVMSRQMPDTFRDALLKIMSTLGLFDLLSFALKNDDVKLSGNAAIILDNFTELNAPFVRNQILMASTDADRKENLLDIIISEFARHREHMLLPLHETLKHLLDQNYVSPEEQSGTSGTDASTSNTEMDQFLHYFYSSHINTLLQPVQDLEIKTHNLTGSVEVLDLKNAKFQQMERICDLISFMVKNHGFRSKHIVISSDLISKITQLLRCNRPIIQAAVIRFYKTCISAKDEFYNRNLVSHNVFEPVIRVLLDTNSNDCLLNSACLSLFTHITQENVKSLVSHLIDQFGDVLEAVTYVRTFNDLRLKYQENQVIKETPEPENTPSEQFGAIANRNGWVSGAVDEEEEDYFNTSDDEEDTAESPEISSTPLVFYTGNDSDGDSDSDSSSDSNDPKEDGKNKSDDEDDLIRNKPVERNPNKENDETPYSRRDKKITILSPKKLDEQSPSIQGASKKRSNEEADLGEEAEEMSRTTKRRSIDEGHEHLLISTPNEYQKEREASSQNESCDVNKEQKAPLQQVEEKTSSNHQEQKSSPHTQTVSKKRSSEEADLEDNVQEVLRTTKRRSVDKGYESSLLNTNEYQDEQEVSPHQVEEKVSSNPKEQNLSPSTQNANEKRPNEVADVDGEAQKVVLKTKCEGHENPSQKQETSSRQVEEKTSSNHQEQEALSNTQSNSKKRSNEEADLEDNVQEVLRTTKRRSIDKGYQSSLLNTTHEYQ